MTRVLVVSTPALLEARRIAAWIARERVGGVRVERANGEWGVFAPSAQATRARVAFHKVLAATNPGGYRIVFKLRFREPYTVLRRRYTFGRAAAMADSLVKGMALKAAVLDPRGKVRFVAFKRNRRSASNPGGPVGIADAAVTIAMRGAKAYLDRHGLKADPGALTATLRSWVKIKLPEALKDAKDAIQAGMHQVAEQTFAATMVQAGIEAAKEASQPTGQNPRRLGRYSWLWIPRSGRAPGHWRAHRHAADLIVVGRRATQGYLWIVHRQPERSRSGYAPSIKAAKRTATRLYAALYPRHATGRNRAKANPSKPIPRGEIEFLVGNLSVGVPDAEVAAEIRRRAKGPHWTPARVEKAVQYAVQVHRQNRSVYERVMRGQFNPRGRGRR